MRAMRIPSGRGAELDEFLRDTDLITLLEKMCTRNDAKLLLYIQYLMEQKAPGNLPLYELTRKVVTHAMKEKPEIFT